MDAVGDIEVSAVIATSNLRFPVSAYPGCSDENRYGFHSHQSDYPGGDEEVTLSMKNIFDRGNILVEVLAGYSGTTGGVVTAIIEGLFQQYMTVTFPVEGLFHPCSAYGTSGRFVLSAGFNYNEFCVTIPGLDGWTATLAY
jgi:hypothetical protein